MTIRSRLTIGYGAGVVFTLAVVGLLVWWEMGSALRDGLRTALDIRAAGVMASLENSGQAGVQETDQTAPGVFVALFSVGGSLLDWEEEVRLRMQEYKAYKAMAEDLMQRATEDRFAFGPPFVPGAG